MTSDYQVVVIGGGPVGLGLAVDLGLRGLACAIVEPRTTLDRIPKGQNLTQRTLEHFARWDLERTLRAARCMPPGYPIGELTAYGDLMSDYWHAPAGREVVRRFYSQDNERLPQYRTEAVLRDKVATLTNVEAFYGWSAAQIEQDETGVRATIGNSKTGEERVLAANCLVGCDGARSLVRTAIGVQCSAQDYEKTMLLAVFKSRSLNEVVTRFPERSTYRVMRPELDGYWQFFGRIDLPDGFFFHAPVPHGSKIESFDSLSLIREAAGFPIECEFEQLSFWRMRVAVADDYRKKRIFIAGDAAHAHPPYGGFGLNNGLEDIVNLGWKLAANAHGWGTDALLESYGQERRPVFWETANDFITARIKRDAEFLHRYNPDKDLIEFEAAWKAKETDIGSRFQQYEPNYEGSSIVFGPEGGVNSAHGVHAIKARPGHHLAPVPLSSGQNSFDALGAWFTLFAFGVSDSEIAAFERAAHELQIPLKVVRDTREGAREAYEASIILARPDQYVVWTRETSAHHAHEVLRRAVGKG